MLLNFYYFRNKKIWLFLLLNFLIGVYVAAVRLGHPESVCFDDLYFYAKEGLVFSIYSDGFDIQTLMSVLNVAISIPMVCTQFSKNYSAKQCYIALRYKNHFTFFLSEIINIAAFCFMLSLFYSLGIAVFCMFKSSFELNNANFILLYVLSVINSTLLLIAFSLFAIPFCVKNDKAAILTVIILFLSSTVGSFYLPKDYKCVDIITVYFVNTLFYDNSFITVNSVVSYSITISSIVFSVAAGGKYLKSRDAI